MTRSLVRIWLISLLALPLALLWTTPSLAQGADAQGWWYALHRAGLPPPPAPPDVAADDLLLQGGDAGALLPPGTTSAPSEPTALAALRFRVAPDSEVGPLVLEVASGGQAVDVRAYPTRSAWVPAQAGAYDAAPAPDLGRYSAGRLGADGLTLVFADIGRLVTEEGTLSIVLVPGPTDRLVLHPPTALALTVTSGPVTGAPPTVPYLPGVPAPASVLPPPFASPPVLSGAVALPPPLQPLSGAQPQVVPPGAAPAPVMSSALRPAAVLDDTRDQVLVALEALLVMVFFGLLGQGPLARLARLTGQAGESSEEARGVGRFREVRTGQAPRL